MASSFLLPFQPLLSSGKTRRPHTPSYNTRFTILAAKKDPSGRMVDENMIILRKRMHETKMVENKYEPPSDWMNWEKRYYRSYDAYVCEMVGLLQSGLMNTRPSLALGFMALITLSLPVSTLVLVLNAIDITKELITPILH